MVDIKNIHGLLKKDMTRKEFLQAAVAAIVGIVGLTAFMKNIDSFTRDQTKSVAKVGYGSSPYGR